METSRVGGEDSTSQSISYYRAGLWTIMTMQNMKLKVLVARVAHGEGLWGGGEAAGHPGGRAVTPPTVAARQWGPQDLLPCDVQQGLGLLQPGHQAGAGQEEP